MSKRYRYSFLLLLAASVSLAACPAHAADSVKQQLVDALLCKRDSLETIRSVVAKPNATSGISATSWGEEMDEKNVVIVQGGLAIAGAMTTAVISDFNSSYADFAGLVFSEFKGDFRKVVKELGLSEVNAQASAQIGKFVLQKPSGAQDEVCPPTIGLTPLGDNRFVLGCGWCNG